MGGLKHPIEQSLAREHQRHSHAAFSQKRLLQIWAFDRCCSFPRTHWPPGLCLCEFREGFGCCWGVPGPQQCGVASAYRLQAAQDEIQASQGMVALSWHAWMSCLKSATGVAAYSTACLHHTACAKKFPDAGLHVWVWPHVLMAGKGSYADCT